MYQNVRGFVTRSLNNNFISIALKGDYTKQFNKSHVGHLRNMQWMNLYNDDLAIQGAARPGPFFAAPESE